MRLLVLLAIICLIWAPDANARASLDDLAPGLYSYFDPLTGKDSVYYRPGLNKYEDPMTLTSKPLPATYIPLVSSTSDPNRSLKPWGSPSTPKKWRFKFPGQNLNKNNQNSFSNFGFPSLSMPRAPRYQPISGGQSGNWTNGNMAPGGGLSMANGGGLSMAPGGGLSMAPGGGLSMAPGGELNSPYGYHSYQQRWSSPGSRWHNSSIGPGGGMSIGPGGGMSIGPGGGMSIGPGGGMSIGPGGGMSIGPGGGMSIGPGGGMSIGPGGGMSIAPNW